MSETSYALYRALKRSPMIPIGVEEGWLVPVQKCVHGSYSEHRLSDGGWCYGAMLDHEPSFIGPVG